MKTKEECVKLAPKGWAYTGFDEGYYCFQKEEQRPSAVQTIAGLIMSKTSLSVPVFYEMLCLEEDLTKENLTLMAQMRITRVRRKHRKVQG